MKPYLTGFAIGVALSLRIWVWLNWRRRRIDTCPRPARPEPIFPSPMKRRA